MDSVVLLPTTGSNINLIGEKQKGAGYSNFAGASHTISITCNNFVGRIYVEASLEAVPQPQDWFAVPLESNLTYVQFPRIPSHPTGQIQGDTGTYAFTFYGNYVWVRARLDRTYLNPQPLDTSTVGSITQILMNYGAWGNQSSPYQGVTGPRGPAGPQGMPGTGATGATGAPGAGREFTFVINYDASGNVASVSGLPVGWASTHTSTHVTVIHPLAQVPHACFAWGRTSVSGNVYQARSVGTSFTVTYDALTPNQFTLQNVTASNTGSVPLAQARIHMWFP